MEKCMFRKSLVFGMLILFVGASIVVNPIRNVKADPSDGLIGYWNFDEGSGSITYDTSGYENHGTVHGAKWVAGISGYALEFDGIDDFVDCGEDSSLDLTNTGTVEAWAYLDSYESIHRYHPNIAGKGANAGWDCPGYTLWIRYDTPQGVYGHIASGYKGSDSNGISFGKPSTGIWHHFVFTWDGNYLRAYIDGSLYEEPEEQTFIPNSVGRKFLMGTSSFRDNYYHGYIDEVRVYNRALTTSEILDHYDEFMPSIGLVGHWSFDEGSGNIAYDSAGDNDGTIYGANWVDGISGSALRFDGVDDYVDITDSVVLDINTDITIECCFKASEVFSDYVWLIDNQYYGGYGLAISSNEEPFVSLNGGVIHVYGETSINDNEWHHLIGTYDGAQVKIYIDGKLENYQDYSTSINYNLNPNFVIGTWGEGSGYFFEGVIDEICVYNRALTAGEIQDHYNEIVGEEKQPPIANAGEDVTAYVGESVSFEGTGSDVDGTIVKYEWDFGDVYTSTKQNPTHVYYKAGHYVATLQVTDNDGLNDTDTKAVEINGRGFWFKNQFGDTEKLPFNWNDCINFSYFQVQQKLLTDPVWAIIFTLYPSLYPMITYWVYLNITGLHRVGHCFGMSSLVVRYYNYPSELPTDTVYDLRASDKDNTGETVYERIDYYQQSQVIDCYTFAKTRLLIWNKLNNREELEGILNLGFPCNVVLVGEKTEGEKTKYLCHAVVAYDYNESSKKLFIYDPNYPDEEKFIIFSVLDDSYNFNYPSTYNPRYTRLCSIGYSDEGILQTFLESLKDSLFVKAECPIVLSVYDPKGNEVGESLSDGENHLVIVTNVINGSYSIKLEGSNNGEYNISMLRFLNNVTIYENISGTIDKDQITTYITFVNESISIIDVIEQFPSISGEGIPGFELLFIICSIALVLLWKKRKKINNI